MALAIAGATPTRAISPTPFTPSGFTCGSCSSTNVTSMSGGASACTGTAYSAKLALGTRPLRASTTECSINAMPMPPGPVGANDAPHTRFTEVRIDGDFHEYGPEGVHGEALTWHRPVLSPPTPRRVGR